MKQILYILLTLISFNVSTANSTERITANSTATFQKIFTQAHNDAHTCAAFIGQFMEIPSSTLIAEIDNSCASMFYGLSIILEADNSIAKQVIDTETELAELVEIIKTMEVTHKLVTTIGIKYFPTIAAVAIDSQTRKLPFI